MAEPAGALAVAGMKKWIEANEPGQGRSLVAIQSGANINFHRLRHISERAELGEHREAILAVTIPERPGSFRQLCAALGDANVTEFNYRHAQGPDAHVFVGVALGGETDRTALLQRLADRGYDVVDMTDVVGPYHGHPKGEICLTMPVTPEATFDGSGAGWCVNDPGSAHKPTVKDGQALVLYLLPDGEIDFSKP